MKRRERKMSMLIFDIETDGLLSDLTQLHCLSIFDGQSLIGYRPDTVEMGVRRIQKALDKGEYIIGHNIIGFDLPALSLLYPWFKVIREQRPQVIDTLVLSRMLCPDVKDSDYKLFKAGKLPGACIGSHTLKAWGYRLGKFKGEYAEETDDAWGVFSEEMLEYNKQDVRVTVALYNHLRQLYSSDRAIRLEHDIQWLMVKQEENGFPFDLDKAKALEIKLRKRLAVLSSELTNLVPPIPDKIFIPKRGNKRLGYKKGVPIQRYKDFNPGSRKQIQWLLENHYHYSISQEKLDEDTFQFIATDPKATKEVQQLALSLSEYLMVVKRLGQLADGQQAWFKSIGSDGKIHGRVNPCGAVSCRATHSSPNIAQVPHNGAPYGKECRSLFCVPAGWWQVGVDACGLELRCLAHYLAPYDKGQYADVVVNGDIHTMNQKAAGLKTRDEAKTFIYALLYGAGDAKIGEIVGGGALEGREVKETFLHKTPAVKRLRHDIHRVLVAKTAYGRVIRWRRRYLKALDGRHLSVRAEHSALNLLLQSAGAIVCKKWLVLTEERLLRRGLKHGWSGDFCLMAWIHDEQQIACRTKEIADIVVKEAQEAMRDTQAFYNFRCQLDADGIVGKNWCECH